MTARVDPKALLEGITAGEWSVVTKGTGIAVVAPPDKDNNPHGRWIAPLASGPGRHPNEDARIMAAAPQLARELIEAREAIEGLLLCLDNSRGYVRALGPIQEAMDRAGRIITDD